MANDDDGRHRQLMDSHAKRQEIAATPVSADRRPSSSELKFDDNGTRVLCFMKVAGLGYLVLRVLPTTPDGYRTIGVELITEGEACAF